MSLAQEIITQTIKDVQTFMDEFAKAYVSALVSSKINGIIEESIDKVIPKGLSGGDDEEADGGDEEKVNDNNNDDVKEGEGKKDDDKPIAAGVHCVGYRNGIGPDRTEHRYYDLACWNIKSKGSIITRVTQRHRILLDQATNLKKKIPNMPDEIFPKKKMGGKDKSYYKQRFQQIRQYYITISKSNDVTTHEDFLVYFRLQEDPKADLKDIFFSALESVCDSSGINYQSCKRKAERLGLDVEPVEMLKVVAVAKVGRDASYRVRNEVANKTPSFVPSPAKNKFINVAETKLAQAISSTVETGWEASNKVFDEVTSKLNDALDKALEPLKDIISKALDPLGNFVKEKFDKAKDLVPKKEKQEEDKGPSVNIDRFAPFATFLQVLNDSDKSLKEAGQELLKKVDGMMECWKFVCYLRYPLGDNETAKEIASWFPAINEILDNHARLTICLTDACYILSHGAILAFFPLLEYVDRAAKQFDDKQHEKELRVALRAGGRSLAVTYFNLPSSLERTLWVCGSDISDDVISLCEETVQQIGDILGNIAINWKPTKSEDVRETFYQTIYPLLNEFVNDRVATWLSRVQSGTQMLIANVFLNICKDIITQISNTLNDLVSNLPDPLKTALKPGDLLTNMATKLANNASTAICVKLAEQSVKAIYNKDYEISSADEWEVRRLRWSPIIKDENDEEGLDEEDDEEDKKDKDKKDNKENKEEVTSNDGIENNGDNTNEAPNNEVTTQTKNE